MTDEIEATFRNIDRESIRSKLKSLGAKQIYPEFLQRRVVFNLPGITKEIKSNHQVTADNGNSWIIFGDKKLQVNDPVKAKELLETILSPEIRQRENKGWLRIRNEANKTTLTYKRQDSSQIDGMREIEVNIDNFDAAFELLTDLGCEYKAYQETKRELWRLNGVDITIDEWPYLEPFVEVEGEDIDKVKEISSQLGFEWEEAYFGAVDGLYTEKYGVTEYQINNETPEITFDKPNPFQD